MPIIYFPPFFHMNDTLVTVREARTLTGVSERTIRRFLQSNVESNSEYFEMEKRKGRDVWLIEAAFLEKQYPFLNAGDSDIVTTPDSASELSQDNKALQRKWQEKKEKQHDTADGEGSVSDESDRPKDGNEPDRHDGIHEENKKLWDLVTNLQEQVAKKDEQLNRYFTQQGELMKTMGRLMEQDNLLLARSQEATIASPPEKGGVADPIDVESTEPIKKSATVQKPKSKSTKKKAKRSANPKEVEETVIEAKTIKKKKPWWSFN